MTNINIDDKSKDKIIEVVNQYKKYYYIKMDMLQSIRQMQQQADVQVHTQLHNDNEEIQNDLKQSITVNLKDNENNIEKNIIKEFTDKIASKIFSILKSNGLTNIGDLSKYIHGEDIFLGFSHIGSIFKDINRYWENNIN